LLNLAEVRASEFGIKGVNLSLVQGVVKNIIPAIASTNAIVAAACANEALKIVTNCGPFLNNYVMYTGDQGVYTYTFDLKPKEDCQVCGNTALQLTIDSNSSLEDLIEKLKEIQ
jgi:ubiquitin-activating enzyme E1 C